MEIYYVLDASAFINGFKPTSKNNYTVPEITAEIKDFESRLVYDRLSFPDKKIIALALMLMDEDKSVKVISDDYTIQNTLKIMNIPYSGIITEGIKDIYNWKKVCQGCKKEFEENYPFDDCDVCGSKIFKKRIMVNK